MSSKVDILLEDDAILLISKPAGVPVIPGRQGGDSIREVLARQRGAEQTFRIVHRIDRETSGVLVLAKTVEAQRVLSDQFFHRQVEKEYLAIVRGNPEDDSGVIVAPIAPHPKIIGRVVINQKEGKPAETRWRVGERYGPAALLKCRPHTGRQHQIRVHLKLIGLPLLVDPLYGGATEFRLSEVKPDYHPSARHEERPLISRLTLHADAITFVHPSTGHRTRVQAPLPKDFRAAMTQLRKLAGIPRASESGGDTP